VKKGHAEKINVKKTTELVFKMEKIQKIQIKIISKKKIITKKSKKRIKLVNTRNPD